jgi:2-polyprenyl-3-methyl-5-hydroxy-6-metoxy-1,4-benzoquinol methylase
MAFRYPRLDKKDLDRLYTGAGSKVWQSPSEDRIDWAIAHTYINDVSPADVLDVGCFDGRFLSKLASGIRLHGIEINSEAVAIAEQAGINIRGPDFSTLDSMPEHFDVITAFDVIEHVESPRIFLGACSRALRRGGTLIIATGNSQSWPWRLLGARNQYCICAEHIAFVNPAWCERESAKAHLHLQSIKSYRRGHFSLAKRAWDIAVNHVYAVAPQSISWLRNMGFGNPVGAHAADHPPLWPSAQDHFIARFKKL